MIEANREKGELFLKHKEEEVKRNRDTNYSSLKSMLQLLQIQHKIVQITTGRCTTSHPQPMNFDCISCQHLHNLRPPNPELPVGEMKRNFIIMVYENDIQQKTSNLCLVYTSLC